MIPDLQKFYEQCTQLRASDPLRISTTPPIPLANTISARLRHIFHMEIHQEIDQILEKRYVDSIPRIYKFYCELKGTRPAEELIADCLRISAGYLTEGVVSAPFEGLKGVFLRPYLELSIAGPARALGGTALLTVCILAEALRRHFEVPPYEPTREQIERTAAQMFRYRRIYGITYVPGVETIRLIMERWGILLNGPGTEEQSPIHQNLPRFGTPKIRGGALLAFIAISIKIKKAIYVEQQVGVDLSWLRQHLSGHKNADEEEQIVDRTPRYLKSIAIGRPIFSIEGTKGGFRPRIGRARNTGSGAWGVHPSLIKALNYIGYGTQLVVSGPGKGASVAYVAGIEPPRALLPRGHRFLWSPDDFSVAQVRELTFLGELAVPLGDYVYANEPIPAHWNPLAWHQLTGFKYRGIQASLPHNYLQLLNISMAQGVPVHPYLHPIIGPRDLYLMTRERLLNKGDVAELFVQWGLTFLVQPFRPDWPELVHHFFRLDTREQVPDDYVAFASGGALRFVGDHGQGAIGVRMGRVEAVGPATLRPAISGLYDLGVEGKNLKALVENGVSIQVPLKTRLCENCGKTYLHRCRCGRSTVASDSLETHHVTVSHDVSQALSALELPFDVLNHVSLPIDVLRLKVLEPIEKVLLRAHHRISCARSGLAGFNASNAILSHFKPCEHELSLKDCQALGYTEDSDGRPLESVDQVVALKPNDVVIPCQMADYFMKVAAFLDDYLEKVCRKPRLYELTCRHDLLGHFVVGQSPHTFIGTLGRIVGFSNLLVLAGTPLFHGTKRRNFDGDEDSAYLLGDVLLNFDREYLRKSNGALMNVPLVLVDQFQSRIIDKEITSMEAGLLPSLFTNEGTRCAPPRVNTLVYTCLTDEPCGYTIDGASIPKASVNGYKFLKTMAQKMIQQLKLAQKIRGVDQRYVAEKVIRSQIIADMKGGIRAFLTQTFRCAKCRKIYWTLTYDRRCHTCGQLLKLCIHPGSVSKYRPLLEGLVRDYELQKALLSEISHVLADLERIDPRVRSALSWLVEEQ